MKIIAHDKKWQSNYDSHDWHCDDGNFFRFKCKNCNKECFNYSALFSFKLEKYDVTKDYYMMYSDGNLNSLELYNCNQLILKQIME